MSYLKLVENPLDSVSWYRVLKPLEGVGPKMAETIVQLVTDTEGVLAAVSFDKWQSKKFYFDLQALFNFIQKGKGMSLSELLNETKDFYMPTLKLVYDDHHKRQQDLESLLTISERYDNLADFLAELSLEPPSSQDSAEPEDNDDEKLVISTIHSAKGLEWHTVFVMSLIDGYFPSFRSLSDPYSIEEERRLLYVALTRAEENLFLLKPHLDLPYGAYPSSGMQFSQLTRFLREDDLIDTYADRWALVEDKKEDDGYQNNRTRQNAYTNENAETSQEDIEDYFDDGSRSRRKYYF